MVCDIGPTHLRGEPFGLGPCEVAHIVTNGSNWPISSPSSSAVIYTVTPSSSPFASVHYFLNSAPTHQSFVAQVSKLKAKDKTLLKFKAYC
ncbi:hypothetical protein CR513_30200, partial [Mucuna pruriens]